MRCREGCSELVQPPFVRIETSTFRDELTHPMKMSVGFAIIRWEQQRVFLRVRWLCVGKLVEELGWNRYFTFLVHLWCPSPLRLPTHGHCLVFEVDVTPSAMHDLLFSHASHPEELKDKPLIFVT